MAVGPQLRSPYLVGTPGPLHCARVLWGARAPGIQCAVLVKATICGLCRWQGMHALTGLEGLPPLDQPGLKCTSRCVQCQASTASQLQQAVADLEAVVAAAETAEAAEAVAAEAATAAEAAEAALAEAQGAAEEEMQQLEEEIGKLAGGDVRGATAAGRGRERARGRGGRAGRGSKR